MSENYIVINGNKIRLTEEQVNLLGFKINTPFTRVAENDMYFGIEFDGAIIPYEDHGDFDNRRYENVNYFNDKAFAKQVALHQLLDRKLLKFAYENGCEDTQPWDGGAMKYNIRYQHDLCRFDVDGNYYTHYFGVYFSTEEGAKRAIKEVIEPFMEQNPDFVW